MKKKPQSNDERIKTICDSMLVMHNSQRATIAWLINIGTKQSKQLSEELKVELSNVESSLKNLSDLPESL